MDPQTSGDVDVKAGEKAADVPPVQADGYVWKLRTTCALLVMWAIVCVACPMHNPFGRLKLVSMRDIAETN
jgi:hypothetical protein